MTYRIRSLRTGFYFRGVDEVMAALWVSGESDLAPPSDYATVGDAADDVALYDLDNVEIVEVPS